MSESLTVDFAQPIPLFPLPNCVLLPHATIPLHVFEPRYRKMVRDALDSRSLIAMSLFLGDDWKSDYMGAPPLRQFACLGYIVKHESLADGRFHILLQGICRTRITKEIPHRPYRMAILEPTETRDTMEIDMTDVRNRLEGQLADDTLKTLSAVKAIHNWLTPDVPTPAMVDLTTMTLCDDGETRYEMLGEPDVIMRAEWLEKFLRHTRHTLQLAERFAPRDMPDFIYLN